MITSQVPAPTNETDPPVETVHTALVSVLNETVRPDDAVAVAAYVPPTTAPPGAVEVNVIVWSFFVTPNDCCTWAAAR